MTKLELFIYGWIGVGEGIARIISFGYWNPTWEFQWCVYTLKRKYSKRDNIEDIEFSTLDQEKLIEKE